MIHTYENAVKISKSYHYLIGKYLETESNIIDICIVPFDLEQLDVFLELYKEKNAEESLQLSGFDRKRVRIVVVHEQTITKPAHMVHLDEFLTKNGIEKNYDQVTRQV